MVTISDISVKKMDNDERKRRGKHPERKKTYYCRECGYQSNRRFNVERHANRMHSKCISKECCHILFFKKSDYYHHIEDYHPGMRASCFVSKKKYKIYGRKLKLSTNYSDKTKFDNTVNSSSNINDECTAMRRSMRIHERVIKRGKLSLKETLTESEFDEYDDDNMDVDYNGYDEHEELIDDLHNYQRMNSLNSVFEEHENSRYEESKNNDESTNNNYCQSNIFHNIKHIQKKYMNNNTQNNIHYNGSSSQLYVTKNPTIVSRLPLKKRILSEINDNIDNKFIRNNKEMKIKKTSSDDKENQNPIDIFLNEDATIVKQILTVEQAIQMWNNITQRQRDYLRYIDFNSF